MLPQVLSGIAMAAFEVALLACAVAAVAGLIIWLMRLQVRTYRILLARHFRPERRTHYRNLGLRPKPQLFKELVDFDAVELLSNGTANHRSMLPRWTLNLAMRLEASFSNPQVLADRTRTAHGQLQDELRRRLPDFEWRYDIIRTLLCGGLGILLCVLVDYSVAATIRSGELTVFGIDGILATGNWASAVLSGILCGVVASIGIALRSEPRLRRDRAPEPRPMPDLPTAAIDDFKVGKPGEAIRAINFSAGAFDTVMHLGVIHALTVLQAKAPHAVVGLSVGALNAVALAEVLQAGEDAEKARLNGKSFNSISLPEERKQIQVVRLVARAKRLREFIEAATRAPEQLVQALLPDAYQIDETRPLVPLRQPRFDRDERRLRRDFVMARAGLARLYNQILDLPLSIGTVTKAIRRVLGMQAAKELASKSSARVVYWSELIRLWVLLGQHLLPLAALARFLRRTFMTRSQSLQPANAALLIFRSRLWSDAKRILETALALLVLFLSWYVLSLIFLVPWIAVTAFVWLLSLWNYEEQELRLLAQDVWQGARTWIALVICMSFMVWLITFMCAPDWFMNRFSEKGGWIDALLITYATPFAVMILTLLFIGIFYLVARANPQSIVVQFLVRYGLNESIFRPHGLRNYLTQLFDRSYYAKPTVDAAVDAALRRKDEGDKERRPDAPKTVSHYAGKDRLEGEKILVGLAVASTEESGLAVVPSDAPLIEALAAATALTPFLPPVELPTNINGSRRQVLYIDGSRVSREPTHALLALIRKHRNDTDHGPLHIYSVTPYPSSKQDMPAVDEDGKPSASKYLDLMDIARRALRLQRFRDASLERRLTELVSSAIPEGKCVARGPDDVVLRTWIAPVELDYDSSLNLQLLGANPTERRALVEKTVADGCRAAMQVMIPDVFNSKKTLGCSDALGEHFKNRRVPGELNSLRLSGVEESLGPGLCEICRSCKFRPAPDKPELHQTLSKGSWHTHAPAWPHEREPAPEKVDPNARFSRDDTQERDKRKKEWKEYIQRIPDVNRWPRDSAIGTGASRPTISLIFSGGVFRGVFQIGVLNGLNEVGLKPDLVAGASVGSITAAMVARAFAHEKVNSHEKVEAKRRPVRIARMAAAFLVIDRLLLTDRFADFVRNLTVRAADTRFSIQDADQVFRKYDYPSFSSFDRQFRRVVAGIERLLYVSPYHLNELVRAIRTSKNKVLFDKASERLQHFLDRMQIGEEALGAEALEELIERHVTDEALRPLGAGFTTDTMREEHGIQFLATTTNLRAGTLEVLGNMPGTATAPAPQLVQALLASSAFPGIFRPRWAWELAASLDPNDRFVDGGIMDNLPLDAIANFLDRAGEAGTINKEPDAPHLMVGASLEVKAPQYAQTYIREQYKSSWPLLQKRVKQLSYNTKLDAYEHAERAIRKVHKHGSARTGFPDQRALLNLQLVSIKPNWLCGTFGVHPMLGFRRKRQMESIAHGCASTIRRFAELSREEVTNYEKWGLSKDKVPEPSSWSKAFDDWKASDQTKGECWLRKGCPCPFSRKELVKVEPALEPALIDEVSKIHELCPKPETHLREV